MRNNNIFASLMATLLLGVGQPQQVELHTRRQPSRWRAEESNTDELLRVRTAAATKERKLAQAEAKRERKKAKRVKERLGGDSVAP